MLQLNDFLSYRFVGQPLISPDGQYVAFLVGQANLKKNAYDKQLWLYDIATAQYREFSSKEISGFYAFDGDQILLTAKREREQDDDHPLSCFESDLYALPLSGGEARFLYTLPVTIQDIKRLDDQRLLCLGKWKRQPTDLRNISDEVEKSALEASVEVIDEIPFWSNNVGMTNKARNRIFVFHENSGEIEFLTDENTQVQSMDYDPKQEEIIYLSSPFEGVYPEYNHLHRISLANGEKKHLLPELEFRYSFFGILNDQSYLFVGADGLKHGINQDHDIYLLDRKSERVTKISPDNWDISLWNSVGSDCRLIGGQSSKIDREKYYFVSTEMDHSYLNVIGADGSLERIITKPGSVDSFDVQGDLLFAVLMRDLELQDLYQIEKGQEHKRTNLNEVPNRLPRIPLESFTYYSNNAAITGYVIPPTDYDPSKKYPGLLSIHGGPKTAFGTVFSHEMQYFAGQGYFVFFTNPHGSDGRGRDFSDIRGLYGTVDYEDLMNFTDEVMARYSALDKDRIGCLGGSYGGFMVNWIIGHTDRFKAACSQRSISNWISKFGVTDIGYFFNKDQHKATPWENYENLWEKSPIKYAPKAKTPTLFIHSEEDYRCHYTCAMQMHTALKLHGAESRLVLFHGENHELSRSGKPKERIRRLYEMDCWFKRYLQDKDIQLPDAVHHLEKKQ